MVRENLLWVELRLSRIMESDQFMAHQVLACSERFRYPSGPARVLRDHPDLAPLAVLLITTEESALGDLELHLELTKEAEYKSTGEAYPAVAAAVII